MELKMYAPLIGFWSVWPSSSGASATSPRPVLFALAGRVVAKVVEGEFERTAYLNRRPKRRQQ